MINYTQEELVVLQGWRIKVITFFSCLVTIFGFFGNALIIVLKTKAIVRESADATYKVTLAVSDSICLAVFLFRQIFFALYYLDPVDDSYIACALVFLFAHSFRFSSAWILVALNVERCTAVVYPLTRRYSWTRALVVSAVIIAVFVTYHSALFFIVTKTTDDAGRRRCGVLPHSTLNHSLFFPWFSMVIGCLVPTAIFAAAHIIILRAMKDHSAFVRGTGGQPSGKTSSLPASQSADHSQARTDTVISRGRDNSFRESNTHPRQDHVVGREPEITFKFILALDVSFFILVFPLDAYVISHFMSGVGLKDSMTVSTHIDMDILDIFAHFNNAVNFYCYYALSWTFRAEFRNIFSREKASSRVYSLPPWRASQILRASERLQLPNTAVTEIASPSLTSGCVRSEKMHPSGGGNAHVIVASSTEKRGWEMEDEPRRDETTTIRRVGNETEEEKEGEPRRDETTTIRRVGNETEEEKKDEPRRDETTTIRRVGNETEEEKKDDEEKGNEINPEAKVTDAEKVGNEDKPVQAEDTKHK